MVNWVLRGAVLLWALLFFIVGIRGVLRGLLPDGIVVHEGMKSGDVDPRCERSHCFTVSDKALAVGGGALEAVLHGLSMGGYRWKQK